MRSNQLSSTVLVVDDDAGTRELVRLILESAGCQVSTAETGHEALNLASSHLYDLMLVDLRLPDMPGLEIIREFKKTQSGTPCVVITAFASVKSVVEAMKLGACDYLEKPLTDVDLVSMVHRAARERRAAEPDTQAQDWRVHEALRMIEANYQQPTLRLQTIASRLQMSTEYLCRLLKRETGNGFCFHLHGVRVREAQRLLRDTQLSAKEIAYHTGYATTSRLDHHFKRVCGTLPIEFRRTRDNERQLSDTEIKNAGSLVVPKGSVEPMITQ